MKERPILMSAPMVRAILRDVDPKTQTRRVMKPIPAFPDSYDAMSCTVSVDGVARFRLPGAGLPSHIFHCPCGQIGDRLWVRETWRIAAWRDGLCRFACDYKASPEETHTPWIVVKSQEWKERVTKIYAELHKIDYPSQDGRYQWEHGKAPLRWCPSIHMPRWASRITLEITGVRVERLLDISEEDAVAEGITAHDADGNIQFYPDYFDGSNTHGLASARESYQTLWYALHGPAGSKGWYANPWVWVIEFKRIAQATEPA